MVLETTDHIAGTCNLPDEGALERERRQFTDFYQHFAREFLGTHPHDDTPLPDSAEVVVG